MADETEPRDQLGPWEASKQKFLRELSPEDGKQFRQWLNDGKSTTRIEDEVRALAEKNANFAKIKPLINGLNALDGLISSLAGLDAHGIVTLLWGSIKILMTLATKAIKFLESISELLDDVGQQLDLFQQYESLFSKHGSLRFNSSLQRVYSTYLYFFSTARDFYQSSGFRKVRESVGLTREKHSSHVKFALEEVKRACLQAKDEVELADKQSRAISDAQIADSVKQVDEEMHNMRLEVGKVGQDIGDMREEIGQKLAKVDYAEFRGWVRVEKLDMEDSLRTNLDKKKASPHTGGWIFSNEKIQHWVSYAENSAHILWLKADAGFGKSVLSSYIIAEMRRLYPTGVAYFFCQHDKDNQRSVNNILRTWIWQLISKQTIGEKIVDSHLAILPSTVVDFENRAEPTIFAMQRLMEQLFRQNKPTRLVLDGLDECEVPTDKEKRDWDILFDLLSKMPFNWKVLISSRPHNWYNDKLKSSLAKVLEEKTITTDDNHDDLREFATIQVNAYAQQKSWTPELIRDTLRLIFDKAQGNMMWVYLLCETFRYAEEEEIQSILDEPPDGLEELYGRALKGLSRDNKRLADKVRRALKWILCAYRPLRMDELKSILGIPPEDVFKYIGPLVKIGGNRQDIRLVHASARDYLLSPEADIFENASDPVPTQLAGLHTMILKKCLEFLAADTRDYVHVGPNQDASEERFRQHLNSAPLLEYACNGWVYHFVRAYKSADAFEPIKPQLLGFLSSEEVVVKWLQVFHFLWNVHAPFDAAREHIAALTNHPSGIHDWASFLAEACSSFVEHLGWEDGQRYTRWDRFMHKRHQYSWDHPFSMYQSPRVMPALSVASFFDYDGLVRRMIADGSDVNSKGPLGGRAMHWAATGGSCKTMRALIEAGADKEARYGKHDETPIFRGIRVPKAVATRPGHWPAAKLLFDEGVALQNEPLSNGFLVSTALIALVEEGPDCPGAADFARDLCSRDPARRGYYVRTGSILQLATWRNRKLILNELLDFTDLRQLLNIQGSSTRQMAVLHNASVQGNREILEILLQAGADPNLRCHLNGYSPLHFAVLAGTNAVDALLEHDPSADVFQTDEISGFGGRPPSHEAKQMPLHLAARYNCLVNFGKFVEKGFNIDEVDGNGDTMLAIALENSHFQAALQLLDLGADPARIPRKLRVYLPLGEKDERLLKIRAAHWQPSEAYAYLFYFRQLSKRSIPIPVMDLILKFAGHTDLLEISRKGRMSVDEHITSRLPRPYIMSPPIMGNAASPVKSIEMLVHSRDQAYANPGIDYSLSKLVTMDRNQQMVHWQPEHKWGRNQHHWQDHKTVVNIKTAPARIKKLKTGERVALFPYAACPAFENVVDRAVIKVRQVMLRTYFTRTEVEQIWGKHEDGTRSGRKFARWKCPRCSAEEFLRNRVTPDVGDGDLDLKEIIEFANFFSI